jgi:hypothetical protein
MIKEEKRPSTLTYAKLKLLITLAIQCPSHLFEDDDDVFFLPSPTIVLIVQQHKHFRKKKS